jgi:hypothetical protein
VALSVYYPNGGNSLGTIFTPTSVNVPANSIGHSSLSITASPNVAVGNYTVDIVGTSSKKVSVTSIIVNVMSDKGFTISVQPSSISNVAGSTNQATVSVTSMNGYNGTVNLEATIPFGYITVTGGQNPIVLQPGQTVTSSFAISTDLLTPLGTYYITITGIDKDHMSSSTIVTLDVVDPVIDIESLTMVSYSFNSDTNMTLTVQNTGSSSITLQFYTVRDSSGDTWTYTYNGNAPVIVAGSTVSVYIVIGMGCNGCTYTGITGLFNQYNTGQSYTVTLTTMAGHQFAWVVNR